MPYHYTHNPGCDGASSPVRPICEQRAHAYVEYWSNGRCMGLFLCVEHLQQWDEEERGTPYNVYTLPWPNKVVYTPNGTSFDLGKVEGEKP